MYRRVLHDELAFAPDDPSMDNDTKSILRGVSVLLFMLLQL